MAQMTSATGSLPLRLSKGETLVIKDLAGSHTVTGSLAPREDASASVGAGFVVYGPQSSAVSVTISTTGAVDYQVVSGDVTPVAPFSASGGSPFSEFTVAARTKAIADERIPITTSGSVQDITVMDTSGTPGPGCIKSFEWITNVFGMWKDVHFLIYVDGEATPSVDIEGHHFGSFFQDALTRYKCDHLWSMAGSGPGFIGMKYPVPYSTSVKVVVRVPAGMSAGEGYFNAIYEEGVDYPWRLKTSGMGYANRMIAVTPANQMNRTVKFLDLPSGQGKAGVIAGFTYCALNVSNETFLESNMVVYQGNQARDGTVVPMFDNTGTEDFFNDFYYFVGGETNQLNGYISNKNGTNASYCMHKDLLMAFGGIAFDDGCLFTMEYGLEVGGTPTTNADLFWNVWYYVKK